MALLEGILAKLIGKVHFYVYVGEAPAAEIKLEDRIITVEILSPVLAVEAGLEEMLKSGRPQASGALGSLKGMGYRFIIRYRGIELEI